MKTRIINLAGFSLIVLLLSNTLTSVDAVTNFPTWVPQNTDIEDFTLLWNETTYSENFICSEAENLSVYSQVWYRNNSQDETVSFIASAITDLDLDILNEKLSWQMNLLVAIGFPEFTGKTSWDLFIFILNQTYGEMGEVTSELANWEAAYECNTTGSIFNYFIIGMVDESKMALSFALELNSNYWWTLLDDQMGQIIGGIVSTLLKLAAFISTLGIECPESSGDPAVPVSQISKGVIEESQYTSREDMVDFNSKMGTFINPKAAIPGYSIGIMVGTFLLICPILFVIEFKKKH
ncbi:hypothetical protein NEF87_004533 [Candidatus Lokiarchaeum ossiferum]|uniref:Uncharacterized protein n=1 Tax=Candidatus Lokiarchaeum ossiferum TaxID=2951803 RepID=A0ABY6HXJ4_9ARCH|nr:hypothetical protein NEF87_004533 [Candidatus Lokiarchaeum sp. B-35]